MRILWETEATYLNTGYATYAKEVMKRLHATGKYELAELASYGDTTDPKETRWKSVPWRFYPVMPDRRNNQEREIYDSDPVNQFGAWKFEQTCLDFHPHIVCGFRDHWMDEHIERSPFRPFYHWAQMPTCDAAPQNEGWISTYLNADAIFTYSDWAIEVLRKQGGEKMNIRGSASPGADMDVFKPRPDRRVHRRNMGIDEDCFIVGTTMRNQKRKLYPDLVQAFAQFLRSAPPEIAKKTFLYLHTSWPDIGWDIPRMIHEEGLGSRCIFTYLCKSCKRAFPLLFCDAKTVCRMCGKHAAIMPNSHVGIERDALADVYNLFDVYVQYSNSEGFGMPQVEGAACGVPVMSVDYSAMSDVVRKLNGYPIKVERMFRESETHCWRALPSNSDLVEKLIAFFRLPEPLRERKRYEARNGALKHYTYDKAAKAWEDYFDSVEERDLWSSPPRLHTPNLSVPNGLSNADFVHWGIHHIAGRSDLANSYMALRMIRDLNWGMTLPNFGGVYFNESSALGSQPKYKPFSREQCVEELKAICELRNYWEQERMKRVKGNH